MKKIYIFLALCLMSVMSVRAEEIYGVFTQNDEVMTLYYDNQRTSRGGLLIDVWPKTNEFLEHGHAVYTVIFDASMQAARPTSTQQWFEEFENLENFVHLEYLNTSNVTHMNAMFDGCMSLTTLNLSGFNTSKLQNTYMMFNGCSGLTKVDLRGWDVSKVTKCSYMFNECYNLRTILNDKDWSQYVGSANGENMFKDCTSLVGENGTTYSSSHTGVAYARPDKSGQPGYFTTKYAVQPMLYAKYDPSTHVLTYYCDSEYSRVDTWITVMDEEYQQKFLNYASDIQKIVIDPSVANGQPVSLAGLFSTQNDNYPMSNMTQVEGLEYINCTRLKNVSSLFDGCTALTSVDLSRFRPTALTDMSGMFYKCYSLQWVDLTNFDMSNVTTVSGMFTSCRNLQTIYCATDWTQYNMDADDLFYDCPRLVGGNGTTYDIDHTYLDYARPDLPGQPGYFTNHGQGVEHVQGDQVQGKKVIREGQLLIERNGKMYNAVGTEVR